MFSLSSLERSLFLLAVVCFSIVSAGEVLANLNHVPGPLSSNAPQVNRQAANAPLLDNRVKLAPNNHDGNLGATQSHHEITIAKTTVLPAKQLAPVVASAASVTAAPQVAHKVGVSVASTVKVETHIEGGKADKLTDYLKPVCNSLASIQPSQLFKIQSQLKTFVQQTNGKLGMCLLEHYGFNPTMKLVSKEDLLAMCNSQTLSGPKSYKSFLSCASKNWDSNLDKELDRILAARSNANKIHHHIGNETGPLAHDDEEMSLISDLVSKVLDDNQVKNSDIKLIDVSGNGAAQKQSLEKHNLASNSNSSSIKKESSSNTSGLSKSMNSSAIINDPNTVVVFVDDTKSKTTLSPSIKLGNNKTTLELHNKTETSHLLTTKSPISIDAHTSTKPLKLDSTVKALLLVTTPKPDTIVVSKELHFNSTKGPISVKEEESLKTLDSHVNQTTSAKAILKPLSTSKPLAKLLSANTTSEPIDTLVSKKTEITKVAKDGGIETSANKTTTTGSTHSIATSVNSTASPTLALLKPSVKPLDTLQEVLKKQEREKQQLDLKLKNERDRVLKQLQKKQDEIDTQNAIKALQAQRDAPINRASDAKLHKLEHERQMTIDPVGHTMKHQQYELSKQQKRV